MKEKKTSLQIGRPGTPFCICHLFEFIELPESQLIDLKNCSGHDIYPLLLNVYYQPDPVLRLRIRQRKKKNTPFIFCDATNQYILIFFLKKFLILEHI